MGPSYLPLGGPGPGRPLCPEAGCPQPFFLLLRKETSEPAASGPARGRERAGRAGPTEPGVPGSAPWPLAPSSPPTAGAGGEAALGHLPSQVVGFVEPHSDGASQCSVRTGCEGSGRPRPVLRASGFRPSKRSGTSWPGLAEHRLPSQCPRAGLGSGEG